MDHCIRRTNACRRGEGFHVGDTRLASRGSGPLEGRLVRPVAQVAGPFRSWPQHHRALVMDPIWLYR